MHLFMVMKATYLLGKHFVLNFQVVLPNQARKIYHALKDKGLPVALVEYEGEQHGFRKVPLLQLLSGTSEFWHWGIEC